MEHHRITTLNINQYDVSAPKPDTHFGYPTNQRSGWSYAQSNVITHPMARPYAQPARGNTFPFLKVEMKSEAADGTIYATENQAAGSGSHSVCSVMASSRSRCPYQLFTDGYDRLHDCHASQRGRSRNGFPGQNSVRKL